LQNRLVDPFQVTGFLRVLIPVGWKGLLGGNKDGTRGLLMLPMQFSRVVNPVEDLQIWNASSNGFSFVISHETPSGPGLHGRPGFMASWRPIHQNRSAIKVAGSPFETFAEAEKACKAMLAHLLRP
jgi:hypothetical protein